MIHRMTILVAAGVPSAGALVGLCWRLARRAHANRKRRLRQIETELRLADALEIVHQEVFRLKHYRVLRPNASRRNAGLFSSTNVSSLRYIKGRQNDD